MRATTLLSAVLCLKQTRILGVRFVLDGLLVTVAPPVQRFDFTRLAAPRCPWLVVQGDADELVNHESVLGWTRALDPAPVVEILSGAEHFFHGRLTVLRSLVGGWLGRMLNVAR